MNFKKNEIYQAEITGITHEGNGVCKIDGFAVFVPDTALGDICEIKLLKVNKNFAYGKVIKIIKPSPNRIEPDCDKFAGCGGCCYRHISYAAECEIKRDYVENSFKRIGGFELKNIDIIAAEQPDEYRNKAQYPVGVDANGALIAGFYAPRSHRIVESKGCRLHPHCFDKIKDAVLSLCEKYEISAYDETNGQGILRHIYIRAGAVTKEIMVCLVVTCFDFKGVNKLGNEIAEQFSDIKSVVLNLNNKNTNVILGEECKTIYGSDTICDVLCGVKVKLSPLSFYQVNHVQAERLYKKAIALADFRGDEILMDLYCGAGTIGLAAADKIKSLVGVEIVAPAIENAKENAKMNGIENARFICADAGQAAQRFVEEGRTPDVIIVDPPRKGLDLTVIDAIAKMSPKKVVMVSCNPTTAARDCKLLSERGYSVNSVTAADLFPRTAHVECVCLMTRNK